MINREKHIKQWFMKQWREDLAENIKTYMKQWRKDNWEYNKCYKNLEKYKRNYRYSAGELRRYNKQWRGDNIEKIRERINLKNKTDLKFNLGGKMSSAIYQSLRGNKAGNRWESLVGYTLADLIKRLKKTMPVGYTWQDLFNGKLHIDHIIPIDAFNFTKPEHTDFKRCWALSNLRLLPARENLIKNAKLDRPFQPALRI